MTAYETQPDGTLREVADPPRRADLVPVVRCRDCEYATKCEDGTLNCHGPLVQTWDYWNDEPLRNPVPPDGFCAWGCRKQ